MKKIEGIQIVHDRGNHWIVASTLHNSKVIFIYDSIYSSMEEETKKVVVSHFESFGELCTHAQSSTK